MAKAWNDINDPGVYKSPAEKPGKNQPVDYKTDQPVKNEKQKPEVKLVSATWAPGDDGLEFNKKCTLNIKAEFLKETFRKKITCSLFVLYNGNEEDVKHKVDAYLDNNGNAKTEMTLYYGNEYYDAAQENPEATCQYKAKIEHPTATAVLESDLLDMPVCMAVDFVEIADIHFHHNCALPCLDEKGELIGLLASVFTYAKDNPNRELIVEGHADTSGDPDYNLTISKRRAEAIKALLENDMALWNGVVTCKDHKLEIEDYQQTLKGLARQYGWPCDPGDVDNKDGPKTKEGVKGFQAEYNSRYNGTLTVDGVVGPKTWEALGITIRALLEEHLKNNLNLDPVPTIIYGYPDDSGVYPCGESCPIENVGDSDYKSEENRRVELVFYKKDDPTPAIAPAAGRKIGIEKDPVSEKGWEKAKVPLTPNVSSTKKAIPVLSAKDSPGVAVVKDAKKPPRLTLIAEIREKSSGKAISFDGKATLEIVSNAANIEVYDAANKKVIFPLVLQGPTLKSKQEYFIIGLIPSANPEDVELKLTLEKTGSVDIADPAFATIKISAVEVAFSQDTGYVGGFDTFEEIAGMDQNGSPTTEKIEKEYSIISVESGKTGSVKFEVKGALKEDIYFTCDVDSIAKPADEQPSSLSGALTINAKAKDKAETVLNARYKSKTGAIVGKLGVVVLKKVTYQAELFRVKDPSSAQTALTLSAVTGDSVSNKVKQYYSQAISELSISGGSSEVDCDYDSNAKSTNNGCLDLEPGKTSAEEKLIKSKCISTKQVIAYVHKLRWSYYLREDAKIGATVVKIKNYGEGYLGYIGKNEYKIEDTDGNSITIKVKEIDPKTGNITLENALTVDPTVAKKAALIWPLGGLGGNPVWVSDVGTEDDFANYCAHELGHRLVGWSDVCEVDNVMYGGPSTGSRIRHRPIMNYYKTSENSTQWLTMKKR